MTDNSTSHMADVYDDQIEQTIPYYRFFHDESINLIKVLNQSPRKWLDTGSGTGNLVQKALARFPETKFVLADPSLPMLTIAREKLSAEINQVDFIQCSTQDLINENRYFDVITAIQSHHYLDIPTRLKATENCFRMLAAGGIYITFENIRPATAVGIRLGLARWENYQIQKGKSAEEAQKHIKRFGNEYFPITIDEHVNMLEKAGFGIIEVFWLSQMQAGFYAIK